MRAESSPLLDRADAVWSNPLLRQMFIVVPVLVDLAFQSGAGTLTDLGPWYFLGVALLAVAVAIAATDVEVGRRWGWLPYVLPALDFAAIGLMRLVPGVNGLGLLIVFPAMWLGIDLLGRGIGLTAVYTALLVCVPAVLYTDLDPVNAGRYLQLLVLGVLAAVTMALTSHAWRRREADAERQRVVISELLEAERASRALNEAIMDAVDVGLLALDPDGSYRSMNPRHEEFMRLAYPEGHDGQAGQLGWVFAADGRTLLTREDMPTVRANQGEDFRDYLIWVGKDPEQRRALSISARDISGEDGARSGQVLVYKDVTDLVRASAIKDEFVASVSHELRTPLTSIMGYIDLTLLDLSLSPQARRQLDVARKNTGRLLRLVNDLLLTAQTDQGHLALDLTLIDLATLVREAVQQVGARARKEGVRLEADLPELVRIQGDPLRLSQVVDNLLSNAVKYSLPGGLVQVSLTVDEATAEAALAIRDQGIGISTEDQERLFTRFFRAQEATERAIQGAGLGLSICKSLVEAHGGAIEVDSAPGAGTTFAVRLPVSVGDAVGPTGPAGPAGAADAEVPAHDPAV